MRSNLLAKKNNQQHKSHTAYQKISFHQSAFSLWKRDHRYNIHRLNLSQGSVLTNIEKKNVIKTIRLQWYFIDIPGCF